MTSPDAPDTPVVPVVPRGPETTRRRILDAARDLFAEHGYDHVSVRAIAERADVNLALINRYFGSKRELFHEVLNEAAVFPSMVGGDVATLPERLARYVVARTTGDDLPSPAMLAIHRSVSSPEVRQILAERMRTILFEPMAGRFSGPEAGEVAAIVTAIVSGAQSVRQLLGPEALKSAGTESAVKRLTAVFSACFDGLEPSDSVAKG
ncbi:MAG TPA: TetR family transcriptional regulator [Streptosporangiaceae bacterium]|jgi:AcrR family transcriptional regulator